MFLNVSRHSGDDLSINFDILLMLPSVVEILHSHESLRQVNVSSNISVRHGADRSRFCGDPTKHWDGFGYDGEMVVKGCSRELAFLRTDFTIDRRQLGIY
jgi:hypothetical protein